MRLNVERLKSDRGIHTLENYFKDMKYRGKGYEREDMDELMKRMEHWAHRLYPSYDFDDFISAVEKLGKKKELQAHMYRYRHNLLEPETSGNKKMNDDDDEADEKGASNMQGVEPIDELDEIIDQQIENYTMMSKGSATPAHERTFDSIRSSMVATPRLREQQPMEASTPIAGPSKRKASEPIAGPSWREDEPVAGPSWRTDPAPSSSTPTLTSEQLARIAENRRLAQERLRQKKMEQAAAEATKAVASTSLNDD